LLVGSIHDIDGIRVRFVRHDHDLNRWNFKFIRYGWIMLLAFPLDYRSLDFIDHTVAGFAKVMAWHNNPRNLSYVLVKCLYNGAASVPRSLVIRQGDRFGNGWSWTVPVFVLNAFEQLGPWFPDEEDAPPGGNPHPLPAPPNDDEIQMADT
jgi:hypothetical protein